MHNGLRDRRYQPLTPPLRSTRAGLLALGEIGAHLQPNFVGHPPFCKVKWLFWLYLAASGADIWLVHFAPHGTGSGNS